MAGDHHMKKCMKGLALGKLRTTVTDSEEQIAVNANGLPRQCAVLFESFFCAVPPFCPAWNLSLTFTSPCCQSV